MTPYSVAYPQNIHRKLFDLIISFHALLSFDILVSVYNKILSEAFGSFKNFDKIQTVIGRLIIPIANP